jgi:hypothetical protein
MKSPLAAYSLPAAAVQRLEAMVDAIVRSPGAFVDPREAAELTEDLDCRAVQKSLPEGISEDDWVSILRLAMLTECATASYAEQIGLRAVWYDAPWLARFNDQVWTPDELTHHTPYKSILLRMGFSEAEIDRDLEEARAREYEHAGGDTPVHVATFGMVQEYLTDHWHGLIARLFKPAAPKAAFVTNLIKKRETMHTLWYRDMAAVQIEANPEMVTYVSEELHRFRMPGNSVAPELQARAGDWLPRMNTDFSQVARDLARLVYTTVASPSLAGRLALDLAERRGVAVGPLSPRIVMAAFDRLGGGGYGLVGEALLRRFGLGYLYEADESAAATPPQRIRALFRDWLAGMLPSQVQMTGA